MPFEASKLKNSVPVNLSCHVMFSINTRVQYYQHKSLQERPSRVESVFLTGR